jgi:hypothetical protein
MHDVEKFFGRGITQSDGIQVRNQIFWYKSRLYRPGHFLLRVRGLFWRGCQIFCRTSGEYSDNRTNAAAQT